MAPETSSRRRSSSSRSGSGSSSSGRRRRRRSSHAKRSAPQLLVDMVQPEALVLWQVLGLITCLGMAVLMIEYPLGVEPWLGLSVGVGLILLGRATRTLPSPRTHPVVKPALALVILLPVLRLLRGETVLDAITDPFLYSVALTWLIVWFARSRLAVYGAVVATLLLLEYYLASRLPGGSWSSTPLFSEHKGFAALVYEGGLEIRLLLILLALILVTLFLQVRVERKRWAKQKLLRGMMYFWLGTGTVGILLAMLLPHLVPVDSTALLAFAVGISLAARQRLIQEDPTRHPPARPTMLRGYLEEAGFALQSLLLRLTSGGGIDPPTPRSGRIDPGSDTLYNPYSNPRPRWVPVALHMHTNRWEGKFSAAEMTSHFQRLGARCVILTDHNRITQSDSAFQTIPAYEHGWGPHSHHVLVLNARHRVPEHRPFGSTLRHKAATLKRLREAGDFLVLAHPRAGSSWSSDDVIQLDYDALELFNKSVDSFRRWDEALSNNRLVWGSAGDDCHDPRSRHQTGKRYLMVDLGASSDDHQGLPAGADEILAALKAGRFLAVRQMNRQVTRELPLTSRPMPERFDWDGRELTIHFAKPIERVRVYGAHRTKLDDLHRVDKVTITPKPGEGYTRIVAEHGSMMVAFNPVARIETPPAT